MLGRHPLDAGGHQVDDGLDLLGREGAASFELEHDGRRRRGLLLDEEALVGQHEVHAGAFDLGQLRDGARQLALQGALVVDALDEIGLADVVLVEEFETHALAVQ